MDYDELPDKLLSDLRVLCNRLDAQILHVFAEELVLARDSPHPHFTWYVVLWWRTARKGTDVALFRSHSQGWSQLAGTTDALMRQVLRGA